MERSLHFDLKDSEGETAREKLDLWVCISTQHKGQVIPPKPSCALKCGVLLNRMSITSHGLFTISTILEMTNSE